jgi:hypothetical protein
MADLSGNQLYAKGREGFLDGTCDWDTHDIKFQFTDHAVHHPDDDDDNLDDIVAAVIATSGNLASKTVTNGVADAADTTVATVSGNPFESIDIYKDSGVAGTSRLIAYIDTATGLPCTPNGGDITVQWDAGANKIFKL